jgi:IS4 transposase
MIAAIYNDRWQVELFFKAIKQNLKIKAFVRTSYNTVLTRIRIALLTYLLLAFARCSSQAGWTVQRVMRVLQLSLFEPGSLEDLVKPDPGRHNKTSLK